jgi:hypothetical protein
VAAARTVVRVFTRFDETALHREHAMTAAARAWVAQVKAGCAGTIPSTIANGTKTQQAVYFDLVVEEALDLTLRALHPVDHAALVFTKGLDHVHFSRRAFTRAIHDTAAAQRVLLALKPSDLCTDVKAAAAGGFAADAPGTTAFLKGIDRLNPGPTVSVSGVIKTTKPDLLTKSDQAAVKRLRKVDARYIKFSANLGVKWGLRLAKVLLSPPPAGGTGGTGGFPVHPPPPPASVRQAMGAAAFATF